MSLRVGSSGSSHQPKEHEHKHFTQTQVAIGFSAARVKPSRRHSRHTHRNQPPGATQSYQNQAKQRPGAKATKGCALNLNRLHQPRSGQAGRASALVVGATNPVRVVISQVAANLQSQRHQGCQQGSDGVEPTQSTSHARACQHRR